MKPEQIIQCQIVDYMSYVCRQNNFMYFSVPNEGVMKAAGLAKVKKAIVAAMMAIMKKMGLIPGVADLVLVKNGRAYFMEVKTEKGRQSKSQTIFERRAGEVGSLYAIVRSLDEAVWTMREWGIIG
jgi:hypothetical protein